MRVAFVRFVRIYGDRALAIALSTVFLVEVLWLSSYVLESATTGERGLVVVAGLTLTLSLAWRRRAPLPVLGLAIVSVALADVFADESAAVGAAVLVAVYSVGAHTRGVGAWIGVFGVSALVGLVLRSDANAVTQLGDVLFLTAIFGGPWVAGRAMRYHRERERMLEQLTLDLEREREERARAAVVEERIRIARELHDVVSHSISVIAIQAQAVRRRLGSDHSQEADDLRVVETTARQAMLEMRRLFGVLRAHGDSPSLAPQPGMDQLERLVEKTRSTGLPVDLCIEGDPYPLAPGVDLAAYRIVQESLTNALRHAGGTRAHITVRYEDARVELEIADDGAGVGSGGGDEGHGLAGMRERVLLYGGTIEAAPRPEGGFRVRATLPV